MPAIEYHGMESQRWTRVWEFKTNRFRVVFSVKLDSGYQYDGDDENGETQAALDSGDFIAFDSRVQVYLDGAEIAADYLGGSVYKEGQESDFWTGHRDSDPMNRNCSIMREARGANVCVGHYFPDMIRTAIGEARNYVQAMKAPPRIRKSA